MRQFNRKDVMHDLKDIDGIDNKEIIETSSLNNCNVDKVFELLAIDIVDYMDNRKTHPFYG